MTQKRYTFYDIENMINLYNNGLNCKEIGKIYHGDGSHICKILREHGLILRPPGKFISTEKELEIVARYNNGDNINDIKHQYKIGGVKLSNILRSHGILYTRDELKHKRLHDNKDDIIYMYTNGYSSVDIAKKYRVGHHLILDFLRFNNITISNKSLASRKYQINEHYFDDIDTEDKAYFFGLLFADGSVHDMNILSISLQDEDSYLLYILNEKIQPDKPLNLHKYHKPDNNLKNQYSVKYNSIHMFNTLQGYGLIPRKSLVKKFPDLILNSSKEIQRHFIRGYFDGNGSIVIHKINKNNTSFTINITSTKEMCMGIKSILLNCCYKNIKPVKIDINLHSKDPLINNYVMIINSNYNIYVFLKWLYKDTTIKMYRKYNRYLYLCRYLQVNYYE